MLFQYMEVFFVDQEIDLCDLWFLGVNNNFPKARNYLLFSGCERDLNAKFECHTNY
jgi:hypothetical protein